MKKAVYLPFVWLCLLLGCTARPSDTTDKEPEARLEYSPVIVPDVMESPEISEEEEYYDYDRDEYDPEEEDSYHKPDISGTIGVVVAKVSGAPSPIAVFLNDDGSEYHSIPFYNDDFYNDEERRSESRDLISPPPL